jgi:hypothetical protein
VATPGRVGGTCVQDVRTSQDYSWWTGRARLYGRPIGISLSIDRGNVRGQPTGLNERKRGSIAGYGKTSGGRKRIYPHHLA